MQKTLDSIRGGIRGGDGFLSHGPAIDGKTMINQNRAAVWWLPVEWIEGDQWQMLETLLIDEERTRAKRFHFERDKLVYIAAHAICRGLLSYCLGQPPQSWRFSVEDHSKPELVCSSDGPQVRVNISHTRGLAAVALTVDNDIGIDVEWLQRNAQTEALAERVFAVPEREALAAAPEDAKVDTFLAFWTLKEAYVKAIGKGLSQPLDAFSFDLEPLRIYFEDPLADNPAQWHFERHQPSAEHLLALAIRHPDPERLVVEAIPAPLSYLLDTAAP